MSANGFEKQKERKARRRSRALRRLGILVPVSVFLSVAPAQAHEKLAITHQPPPAAVEGRDVELAVAVLREGHPGDSLSSTYGPITVTVHYQSAGGTKKVSAELARFGGAARLTITGRDVAARMLRYWVTASQESCVGLWSRRMNCEEVSGLAPEQGMYLVPVQSAEPHEPGRPKPGSPGPRDEVEALRDAAVKPLPPPPIDAR